MGSFKFFNDTGGYVLVQAWTDYPHVIVEIFGNDDGRKVVVGEAQHWEPASGMEPIGVVDASKPAGYMGQTGWPPEGLEALFTQTVTYPDGEVVEHEFYSPYKGHGDVWTVSPDMEGQSPAA